MVAAAALREENAVAAMSRDEVMARYRTLREISKQHHAKVLDFLSPDAILHQGRRLGLLVGKTFVLDNMDDLNLAFDLAIYTAPLGRSRAIDRYANAARLAPGSNEALVLDAMCGARFALVRIERRHAAAGLIVKDVIRRINYWLVDEGLESSVPDGSIFATRLFAPEGFSMTAGVNVPFDLPLLRDVLAEVPQLLRKPSAEVSDDRRFAEAIYRLALASGVMERVAYQDPVEKAG